MSATALKSTKRRFSSLNHQNFEFFGLVPRSPTHTGLICGKTLEPNISSLGPFKKMVILMMRAMTLIRIYGDQYVDDYDYVTKITDVCTEANFLVPDWVGYTV
jgi:hypothetical protein